MIRTRPEARWALWAGVAGALATAALSVKGIFASGSSTAALGFIYLPLVAALGAIPVAAWGAALGHVVLRWRGTVQSPGLVLVAALAVAAALPIAVAMEIDRGLRLEAALEVESAHGRGACGEHHRHGEACARFETHRLECQAGGEEHRRGGDLQHEQSPEIPAPRGTI